MIRTCYESKVMRSNIWSTGQEIKHLAVNICSHKNKLYTHRVAFGLTAVNHVKK